MYPRPRVRGVFGRHVLRNLKCQSETLKSFPRGNIELSVERALVVWDYLIGEGKIDQGRLSVIGFGATRPRVPNTSELARYKNRRVEIRVAE